MKLSKATQKQVDQALSQNDAATQARMLAVIHRCGNNRERKAVDALVSEHNLGCHLNVVNGCYVPRG